MALRLNGQTTGYTELNAPANGDSVVLTMPGNDGNAGQYLQTNGSGALSWATLPTGASWTSSTVNISGTTVDVTGIPSTARYIIYSWDNANSTGNSEYVTTFGTSSGFASSGYEVTAGYVYHNSLPGVSIYTTNATWRGSATGGSVSGKLYIHKHSSGIYHFSGIANDDANAIWYQMTGSINLGGDLDRIRLGFTSGGFDTQGTITVQYLEA